MSKLRIDYVNFHEKMLDPIVKAFGNNKLAVVNVKASNMAKRENGVAIKEAQFEFKSGQKLVLKVKADGGVFQVKLNGKVLPVKEVFDIDAAFKEIVKMAKQNEAAYLAQKEKQQEQAAKRLARTAVVRASSSAQAKLEAAQAKLAETNDMISTTRTDAQPYYDNLSAKQTELSQLTGRISDLETRNTELDGLIKEAEIV
jgi:glucan-binding YG repeat protein